MKTAICFTGTARSLEHTYKNIQKKLIDPIPNCDVFLLIAQNPHADKATKYFQIPELKRLVIEEEPEYDISGYRFRPLWPSPKSISSRQIYIKMVKSRERCNEILSDYETQTNSQYDRVIFSRLDVKYFDNVCDHIEGLDLEVLHVPDFHNTFGDVINGHNDRFAVSNRENMDTYFRVLKDVNSFLQQGGEIHAETLLKWHLDNNNTKVNKIPIRFTRVRPDGEEIETHLENIILSYSDT